MPQGRYHHGNLRQALIGAATALIEADGTDGFSLSAASRALGVTHAAAYKHFADRDALVQAVSNRGMEAFGAAIATACDGEDGPRAQYLAAGRAVVQYACEHPHVYMLAFGSARRDDLQTLANPAPGTVWADFVARVVGWQEAGFLAPGEPMRWATALWAAVHGLAHLVSSGRLAVGVDEALALSDSLLLDVHHGIGTR